MHATNTTRTREPFWASEPFGIFNPILVLDSEIHIVLENKQQQQQRIYERIFEVISFSFFFFIQQGGG